MSADPYPSTVASVLVPRARYKPEAIAAIKKFRAAKPWQGTQMERAAKIQALYVDLAAAYGISTPILVAVDGADDCYLREAHRVVLNLRKLSVVTALHEFGHALGKNERQTCRWSINLFKRFFPRSYAALEHDGHHLRRRRS